MENYLKTQILEAQKQIKESKKYAKQYQNTFKEQADRCIKHMKSEVKAENLKQKQELQDTKKKLENIQREIATGNVNELLEAIKGRRQ